MKGKREALASRSEVWMTRHAGIRMNMQSYLRSMQYGSSPTVGNRRLGRPVHAIPRGIHAKVARGAGFRAGRRPPHPCIFMQVAKTTRSDTRTSASPPLPGFTQGLAPTGVAFRHEPPRPPGLSDGPLPRLDARCGQEVHLVGQQRSQVPDLGQVAHLVLRQVEWVVRFYPGTEEEGRFLSIGAHVLRDIDDLLS